ncbi:hypothetical protein WUBG_13682, partial [Wuchereria bancrofti]
ENITGVVLDPYTPPMPSFGIAITVVKFHWSHNHCDPSVVGLHLQQHNINGLRPCISGYVP